MTKGDLKYYVFFLERGEMMTNKAISHVVEAEETVARIRENAAKKQAEIEAERDSRISQIEQQRDEAIKTFKKEENKKYEEALTNKIEEYKLEIENEAQRYEASYNQKQKEITDYIVREVLKRYGNK